MHRLGELVIAVVAGSFFAHGKKFPPRRCSVPAVEMDILENGSWKEHPETQGCSRSERHSDITCAVPRCSRLLSPLVTPCTSRGD